ncbi:Argonaute-like protein, partial [Sarcoptes scabiei]
GSGDRGRGSGSGDRGRGSGRGGHHDDNRGGDFRRQDRQQVDITSIAVKNEILRPSQTGSIGTPIKLIANVFKVNLSDKIRSIVLHDVKIQEKFEDESKVREINEKFLKRISKDLIGIFSQKHFPKIAYAFNGMTQLFTLETLPNSKIIDVIDYTFNNKKLKFEIIIKETKKKDLSHIFSIYKDPKININTDVITDLVNIYQLVLNNSLDDNFGFYQRKYFRTNNLIGSKNIYEFIQAFVASVYTAEIGVALNLHLKTVTMIASSIDSLQELIRKLFGKDPDTIFPYEIDQLNKIVRHKKIYTMHCNNQKMLYMIEKVILKRPKEVFIPMENNQKKSISQYFKEKYSIETKNYPLVKLVSKKELYLPLELCKLVDKQFLDHRKLNDPQLDRHLLDVSTHQPQHYIKTASDYVREIQDSGSSYLSKFGMQINVKPSEIMGRVLPSPDQFNLRRDDRFYDTTSNQISWAIFSFDSRTRNEKLEDFNRSLVQKAKNFGLVFYNKPEVSVTQQIRSLVDVKNVLMNLQQKFQKQIQIVFFVIPQRHESLNNQDIYNVIKALCDRAQISGGFGFRTQCINASKLNLGKGYIENLLLKINGKLGGSNSIIKPTEFNKMPKSFKTSETIVFGVDVHHAGLTEQSQASIAAVVGSLDEKFSKFTAAVRIQPFDRDEIILNIDSMFEEILNEYKRINGHYPKTAVIFRDGVSDGQLPKIEDKELAAIKKVFQKLNVKVNILLFVVQKRHNFRFISVEAAHGPKKNSHNVPSGTVVDNSIVSAKYVNFFINSHYSMLGTSKPTKYICLRNDWQLSKDQLHLLCFFMCFNCIRFRGVIAIPTAIRYADLCAYRSKIHLEARLAITGIDAKKKQVAEIMLQQMNDWIKVDHNVRNYLYYC